MYRIPDSLLAIPAPSTEETFGYPAVSVDKRVVVQMLRSGSYAELDQYFSRLQSATLSRIQLEYDFLDASRAFNTGDTTLGPLIEAWIASAPASAHARTARATWYLGRAWYVRGGGFAKEVSEGAMWEMGRYAALAGQEARTALELDSTHLIAYYELLRALQLTGEPAEGVLGAGRRHFPGSYILPRQHLNRLLPRWGGSYRAMAAFAAHVAADSLLNPRLVTLQGAVAADLSKIALSAKDFDEAIGQANAALRYGPELFYLLQRGEVFVRFLDNGRGIADLNAVLARRPQDPDALRYHGWAAGQAASGTLGHERRAALAQSRADFELILAFDPTDSLALEGLARAVHEQEHCPNDFRECGGSQAGVWATLKAVFRDMGRMLAFLGVLGFVGVWGFFKWARNGFWVPGYVHLLAFAALALVVVIDIMWVRTGMPMTTRRWLVIPFFPGVVYFLFIGLGGVRR